MDKTTAIQTISGIYNMLNLITVSGEGNINMMAGTIQAVKELGSWIDELKESGDDKHDESEC